jgi:hypothetical protein
MSKSSKQPVKGSIQYIRSGLTVSRFSQFLKRIGTKEVGIAGKGPVALARRRARA